MSILNFIRSRIGNVKQVLPFVKLFGYENVYGKPREKDYDAMVSNFKSWVYACAQRNAFSVAKCELLLFNKVRKEGKLALEEIEEHPFLDLMSKVNPFFNKFELWVLTTTFLELTGNAYWWIISDQLGVPREIWNLPANWMKIVPSKETFIAGYVMQPPGVAVPIPFQEEEIIHFKYPSPFDIHYGTGPLIASQYGVDLNNQLKLHGINYLMNNAQPAGALYTQDSLNDNQFKRLKAQWNKEHRGASNAGKMAILEAGLKYQQIGQGLSELRFEEIAKSVRDEILAVFGVPASKLGIVEDVNRANADANDYTYQKDTILPKLILIEEKLNEKMLPRYDSGLVVKFANPVPEDKEFRLREQTEHIRSGYSSIDDERVKDDEKPYNQPETQAPLIPFSVIPAGTEREDPMAYDDEDSDKIGTGYEKKSQKTKAKARRRRKWEIFAAMTAPQERLLKRALERFFKAQRAEVTGKLANFKAMTKDSIYANIIFNLKEQNEKLKEISRAYVSAALMGGANLAADELSIDFGIIEPRVLRAVEHRVNFFAEKVNESTITLLNDELQEAMIAGESIESVARRIDKVFDFSEHYRSVRIARTEIIGASNQGQLDVYKDAGVEKKQWITARDEKVRDSHQIDGQTVDITEDFVTGLGSHLQYPGDRESGAPISDIVNCRCTQIAVRTKE